MSTSLLLELFAGFLTAVVALWMVGIQRSAAAAAFAAPALSGFPRSGRLDRSPLRPFLDRYFLRDGLALNAGLLVLRLAIGVMMIHHGQDKLADPQSFADNYVAALHFPFPLFFAYAAGIAEVMGSWLLILGLLSPLGALALTGTMTVAAAHHILSAGLNIYVLELVVLYLGGSIALLLIGPGRFSFDAGIVQGLFPAGSTDPGATSPRREPTLAEGQESAAMG